MVQRDWDPDDRSEQLAEGQTSDCIATQWQKSKVSNVLPADSLGPVKPEVGRVFVLSNQMILPLFGCSKCICAAFHQTLILQSKTVTIIV